MSKRKLYKLATLFAAAVIVMIWDQYSMRPTEVKSEVPVVPIVETVPTATSSTTNAFVIRAVDGDTLDVRLDSENKEVKVRMLGVDTPETVDPRKSVQCFGKEASKHTASLTAGKRVNLVSDPKADEIDKYGRLLRNVILDDGTDLNAALVRDGYAYAYLSFPLDKARKAELTALQKEATAAKRGLWNPDTCNGKK